MRVYLVGMDLGLVVGLALVLALCLGLAGLLRVLERSSGLGGGGRSTGIAGALAEIDAVFQPQRPTAEQLERLRRGEHEDDEDDEDDEGDDVGRVPDAPVNVAASPGDSGDPSTRTPGA